MTTNDVPLTRHHAGGMAVALAVTSATLFVVGWAWDHRYVPLLFAAAPIVALAGLAFASHSLPSPCAATSEQPFRRSSVPRSRCWYCSAMPTRCWLMPPGGN
jgi:hypothetical protein